MLIVNMAQFSMICFCVSRTPVYKLKCTEKKHMRHIELDQFSQKLRIQYLEWQFSHKNWR